MTHKRIRKAIFVICTNCMGSGNIGKDGFRRPCPECKGAGEVQKFIVEFVTEEEVSE